MAPTRQKITHDPALIVSIEVDALFGNYTYQLGINAEKDQTPSQLLLLYGDNGSGKTTIAQLLFHLLSQADGKGHRTFMAQTKFKRFAVHFNNRIVLSAHRESSDSIVGPYTISLKAPRRKEISVDVSTNEDGVVKTGNVDEQLLQNILGSVSDPPLSVYFLSDNRMFQSDVFEDHYGDEWRQTGARILTRHMGDSVEKVMVPVRSRDLTVAPYVSRTEIWLRKQAISASNAGEATMSNIYSDIIKRIANATRFSDSDDDNQLLDVNNSLELLAARAEDFVSLGLSQPVPIKDLRDIITSSSVRNRSLLASVLEPYLDSINSRLDAYEQLQKKLAVFLRIINSFYKRKYVSVTLSDGITILDDQGNVLDPDVLSSGEKQLLLLLCNILVATSNSSLFIIDEPELSLNVKWQRQLVESLLELAEGSQIQFIMATHSIELLTRHKDLVLLLDDITTPRA